MSKFRPVLNRGQGIPAGGKDKLTRFDDTLNSSLISQCTCSSNSILRVLNLLFTFQSPQHSSPMHFVQWERQWSVLIPYYMGPELFILFIMYI